MHTFDEPKSGVTDLLPVGFCGSSRTGVVIGEEVTDVSDLTEEAVSKGGFLFIVESFDCAINKLLYLFNTYTYYLMYN